MPFRAPLAPTPAVAGVRGAKPVVAVRPPKPEPAANEQEPVATSEPEAAPVASLPPAVAPPPPEAFGTLVTPEQFGSYAPPAPDALAAPDAGATSDLPLLGLPVFDGMGGQVVQEGPPPAVATPALPPTEHSAAAVLDSIAARIRAGTLVVPEVQLVDGDAAALATVLAALLRQR